MRRLLGQMEATVEKSPGLAAARRGEDTDMVGVGFSELSLRFVEFHAGCSPNRFRPLSGWTSWFRS